MKKPKIEELNRVDIMAPLCPWCKKRGDPTEFMRHDHNVEIITECPYCDKKYTWE